MEWGNAMKFDGIKQQKEWNGTHGAKQWNSMECGNTLLGNEATRGMKWNSPAKDGNCSSFSLTKTAAQPDSFSKWSKNIQKPLCCGCNCSVCANKDFLGMADTHVYCLTLVQYSSPLKLAPHQMIASNLSCERGPCNYLLTCNWGLFILIKSSLWSSRRSLFAPSGALYVSVHY